MKIKNTLIIMALVLSMLLSGVAPAGTARAAGARDDMRGIWLSFNDYVNLGFSDTDESTYIKRVDAFLETAYDYDFNAIFLHVRAFDDAFWPSSTFPASSYMISTADRSRSAAETYSYDPLEDFIKEAKEYDIEVHAWMNPYRISHTRFLDPSKATNQNRVKKAIKELLAYDLAGIHFDDYFYHSQGGYVKNYKSEKEYAINITAAQKRKYVNKLVKSVHKLCAKNDLLFGISPQGNVQNDMSSGADVKTWLSKSGYVDYLVPQIYWSNRYGADSNVTMFSDRLNEFHALNTGGTMMYAGLALYRCGFDFTYDHGWVQSNTNMRDQIAEAESLGWGGYLMFAASNLYNKESKKERAKL